MLPEMLDTTRRLIVKREDPMPVEATSSVTIQGKICKQFREADNILAQQMVDVAAEQNKGVSVISADTDEFALLLHHYTKVYWDGNNGVACLRPGFY